MQRTSNPLLRVLPPWTLATFSDIPLSNVLDTISPYPGQADKEIMHCCNLVISLAGYATGDFTKWRIIMIDTIIRNDFLFMFNGFDACLNNIYTEAYC
jgi:hypothetical protein